MNAPDKALHSMLLPDIQGTPDHRNLAIQEVGVRDLRYPINWIDAQGQSQRTVATITMTVGLPPSVKGTHMSRFIEILETQEHALNAQGMRELLNRMQNRLTASSGKIDMSFPYFIEKQAPVSKVKSLIVQLIVTNHLYSF